MKGLITLKKNVVFKKAVGTLFSMLVIGSGVFTSNCVFAHGGDSDDDSSANGDAGYTSVHVRLPDIDVLGRFDEFLAMPSVILVPIQNNNNQMPNLAGPANLPEPANLPKPVNVSRRVVLNSAQKDFRKNIASILHDGVGKAKGKIPKEILTPIMNTVLSNLNLGSKKVTRDEYRCIGLFYQKYACYSEQILPELRRIKAAYNMTTAALSAHLRGATV